MLAIVGRTDLEPIADEIQEKLERAPEGVGGITALLISRHEQLAVSSVTPFVARRFADEPLRSSQERSRKSV
jgi:hypothetical protein